MSTYRKADYLSLLSLFACWLLGIIVVGAAGDFPLNDDWSYARGVYSIVEEGELKLETWPAMTLIAQIGIGSLFCELFGFSFTTLRWSTLVVGLLSIFCFYALLRKFAKPSLSFFACVLLLFNPLFFSLSFTFMTEVHFLFPLLAACLFFSQYIEKSNYSALLIGTLFSIYATLVRQPGVLIPLAFGIVLVLSGKSLFRKAVGVLPFLVSYISLKVYYRYLETYQPQVHKVGGVTDLLTSSSSKSFNNLLEGSTNLLLYPALFLLPLAVLLLHSIEWKVVKKKVFGSLAALLIFVLLVVNLDLFPIGNILYNLGLGPRLLIGVDLAMGSNNIDPVLDENLWGIIDYLAIAGAAGVLLLVVAFLPIDLNKFRKKETIDANTLIKWSILLFCGAYFLLMLLIGSLFDRYTLILIPLFAILILPEHFRPVKSGRIVAWTLLTLMAGFSIAATHDYLSWNRARKEAFDYVNVEKGIAIDFIDAGFELNGWDRPGPDRYGQESRFSWWFVNEDDYAISFGDVAGFSKWKTFAYPTLLPPGTDSMFLLQKDRVVVLEDSDFPIYTDLERLTSNAVSYLSSNPKINVNGASLQSQEHAKSGTHSIRFAGDERFGLTTKLWGLTSLDTVTFSMWRYPVGCRATLVTSSDYQKLFYQAVETVVETDSTGWEKVENTIVIPPFEGIDRVSVYVWNRQNEAAWVDDLKVERKKYLGAQD